MVREAVHKTTSSSDGYPGTAPGRRDVSGEV